MSSFEERLSDAAAHGNIPMLRDAFERGVARPDMTFMGIPLVSSAAWGAQSETVRFLLNAGAKANQQDRHGTVPLVYAALAFDAESASILMDFGGDENRKDKSGMTAEKQAKASGAFNVMAAIAIKKAQRKARVDNIVHFPRAKDWNYPTRG